MVKVIFGEKGTGKTKQLIEAVHNAEKDTNGNVVFINKGDRHVLDLTHNVRLVNTDDFGEMNYDIFFGLVCGMISQNFDIAHIFVDSITKIVLGDYDALEKFLNRLDCISKEFKAEVLITISEKAENLSDGIKKFA